MRFFLLYDPIISYICRSLYYRRRVDDEAIGSDERISVLGEAFRHEDVMGGGGGCMMDVNCGDVSSFLWGGWLG